MKSVNRYISLLLICGLMLPLYNKRTYNNISKKNSAPIYPKGPLKGANCKSDERGFSFFKNVISNIAPALKNLK
jgi:hypothetical protein